MVFSSNVFLFLFLPLVLIGYFVMGKRLKNAFLLLVSLLFYAWGEPVFVWIMIGSILFNYGAALVLDRLRERPGLRKYTLALALAANLSILFMYKYFDFFAVNANAIVGRLGFRLPMLGLALPIGISFFTFQAMSYLIDVYRGVTAVQRKPQHVGLYIAFFPQLMAGPIIRYQTIEKQIESRTVTWEGFSEGVHRFIMGFCKKILIANNVALIADQAFALPDAQRSVVYAWIGVIAYSLQIFFDFSGYSDMAIGLGRMFGFRFLENFDHPYASRSVSEFWRRWHISLGQWFRDYVYFPLGGSRVAAKSRLVFNLFVVWLLTGIWHGASWNFVLWGLMYFVLIAMEKLTGYPGRFRSVGAKAAYRVFTLLCVMGGWALFRASGAGRAGLYLQSMIGMGGNPLFDANVLYAIREYWVFLLAGILCSTTLFQSLRAKMDSGTWPAGWVRLLNGLSMGFYLFCFVWAVSFLVLGAYSPFIYFNF